MFLKLACTFRCLRPHVRFVSLLVALVIRRCCVVVNVRFLFFFFLLFFFLLILPPPTSTLFPYTTLFRSDLSSSTFSHLKREYSPDTGRLLVAQNMIAISSFMTIFQKTEFCEKPFIRTLWKSKFRWNHYHNCAEIGRAHVWTPVTATSRMPSSAWTNK